MESIFVCMLKNSSEILLWSSQGELWQELKSHGLKPAKFEQANNNKSLDRNADCWEKTRGTRGSAASLNFTFQCVLELQHLVNEACLLLHFSLILHVSLLDNKHRNNPWPQWKVVREKVSRKVAVYLPSMSQFMVESRSSGLVRRTAESQSAEINKNKNNTNNKLAF